MGKVNRLTDNQIINWRSVTTKYNFLFCIQACLDFYGKFFPVLFLKNRSYDNFLLESEALDVLDFSRFRLFLDGCLIKFNKEKVVSAICALILLI